MKTPAFLFLLLLGTGSASAQNSPMPVGQAINVGRIHMASAESVDAQYLVIAGDSVEYYERGSSLRHVVNLSQVSEIHELRGHRGRRGTWIGSFLGLGAGVGASLATVETERTDLGFGGYIEETKIQLWPMYLLTATGGLIGYAVGRKSEKWHAVYRNGEGLVLGAQRTPVPYAGGLTVSYRLTF